MSQVYSGSDIVHVYEALKTFQINRVHQHMSCIRLGQQQSHPHCPWV